jgi:hypothetical protein
MQPIRRWGFTVGEFIVCAIIFVVLCVGLYYVAGFIRDTVSSSSEKKGTTVPDSQLKEKFTKFTKWEFPKNPTAGQEVTQLLGDSGVKIPFCWIPDGKFQRGENDVIIDKGFWIAKYETTQAQWNSLGVRKKKECHFKGDNLPVENVYYDEAISYAQKLKNLSGCGVRLPTAVEWTYACFAGLPTTSKEIPRPIWRSSRGIAQTAVARRIPSVKSLQTNGDCMIWLVMCRSGVRILLKIGKMTAMSGVGAGAGMQNSAKLRTGSISDGTTLAPNWDFAWS